MYPETFRRGYRRELLILGMSITSFFIGLIMCTEVSNTENYDIMYSQQMWTKLCCWNMNLFVVIKNSSSFFFFFNEIHLCKSKEQIYSLQEAGMLKCHVLWVIAVSHSYTFFTDLHKTQKKSIRLNKIRFWLIGRRVWSLFQHNEIWRDEMILIFRKLYNEQIITLSDAWLLSVWGTRLFQTSHLVCSLFLFWCTHFIMAVTMVIAIIIIMTIFC